MQKPTDISTSRDGRHLPRRVRPRRWWLLALAWMGVIYFLSAQSNLVLPVDVPWSGLLSWIAHFAEYAVLAGLLWLALRSSARVKRHATTIAFVLTALYALSDEVHQSFVPGRMPDIRDWMVDVAAAALVLWILSRSRT